MKKKKATTQTLIILLIVHETHLGGPISDSETLNNLQSMHANVM